MTTFIVAIPFFDSDMSVHAYRLNSRSGKKLLGMLVDEMSMSDAVLTPGLDLIKSLGVEPLTGGFPLFVDINEYHLLMRASLSLEINPELLVCTLPSKVNADGAVMEKCRELLRETDIQIGLISKRLGFSSFGYFINIFRQHFGITPSDYRRRFHPTGIMQPDAEE